MEGRIGLWCYIELFKIFFLWNRFVRSCQTVLSQRRCSCRPVLDEQVTAGPCHSQEAVQSRQRSDFTTFQWSHVCDLCSVMWVDFCSCYNEDTELFHHRDLVLSLTSHIPCHHPWSWQQLILPCSSTILSFQKHYINEAYRMWSFEIGFFTQQDSSAIHLTLVNSSL